MNDIKNIALATAIGIAGAGAAYLMATKKLINNS